MAVPGLRGDKRLTSRNPIPRIGMGRLPLGQATATSQLLGALQHLEDADHLTRVVSPGERVTKAELIGLRLIVATVLEEHQSQSGSGDLAILRDRWRQHRSDAQADRRDLLPAHLLHTVPGRDVTTLVAQD
jgi:hypothetical protein